MEGYITSSLHHLFAGFHEFTIGTCTCRPQYTSLHRVSYGGGGGGGTWEIPPKGQFPPPPKILATILINTDIQNFIKFSRGPSIAILIRRVRFK